MCTPRWFPGAVLPTRESTVARKKRLSRATTMVQVRSLETAEVTNGEHITVRSESALDSAELTKLTFPLKLHSQGMDSLLVPRKLE